MYFINLNYRFQLSIVVDCSSFAENGAMYSIVSASTGSWTCNFPRNFNRTFVKFVTLVSRENTILFLTDVVLFFKWQLQTSYPAEEAEKTPVKNALKRFIGIKRLKQPEISRKEANLEKLVSN